MRPLSTYIEFLLMTRHYAFVPGLGGFMFQEEPSRMMLGGRLMPPLRLLKYSRLMDHDDGMLANVIMRAEGLSYDEANQSIRLSVADVLNSVQHEGRCALGRLGFIFADEDCHIAFRAADQVDQDPVYYGMAQLNVRSWRDEERIRRGGSVVSATDKPKKPVIKRGEGIVELPFRWLLRAAVIALVVTFVLVKFMPWGGSANENANYANLVDTGLFHHDAGISAAPIEEQAPLATDITKEDKTETPSANTTTAPTEANDGASAHEIQSQPVQKTTRKALANSGKTYLIIVGSCETRDGAERLIRRLERKGYDGLEILERDGRFRVYIEQFAAKAEAVSYLNDLRATTTFSDAWLLAVRGEAHPLSYNIKNKDNDQLPMELSHLNRTTERDQG